MDRLQRIAEERKATASRAAKLYQDTSQSLRAFDPAHQIEREKLYWKRERNRSNKAIINRALERIINGDQSTEIWPNENAKKSGVPVGRLYEIGSEDEPKGFGTGFLVASSILITNNHVFKKVSEALNCAVNFSYEVDKATNEISPGTSFRLMPDTFFYTCEELDFTILAVEDTSIDKKELLSTLGCLSLIGRMGKIKIKSIINIIQYPGGGRKKYATEDNYVTAINDQEGTIFYTTDTQKGSSGAVCFNEYWEVAALHYSAVPKINEKGEWLTVRGEVWNEAMSDDDVDWIANAGISISKIIDHLKAVKFNESDKKYADLILNASQDPLAATKGDEKSNITQNTVKNNEDMGNMILNFYGTTTVNISGGTLEGMQQNASGFTGIQNASLLKEKKERFNEDYKSRKGYLENFIEGFKVPFPKVTDSREKELYRQFGAQEPYIVPYIHFSLVMNKKRRMLMWAAANVDYSDDFRDSRSRTDFGSGAWRLDDRVPHKYQIQAHEFYDPATLVDKGHIVRRDDNCWAELINGEKDLLGIEYSNADTFHWTNCTPQHEAFNRDVAPYKGVGLWGILENAIKKQLEYPKGDKDNPNKDYEQKACVLSGPIFSDDDPEYMDIQYPLKFWKIFAIRSRSEGNLVYGFILSQEDKVSETGVEIQKEGRPRFNAKVKAMQVSLREIEKQSGVLFDDILHEFDVKRNDNSIIEIDATLKDFKSKK